MRLTADIAARAAGCSPEEVFLASTGVIGEPLAAEKFEGVLADCAARAQPDAWLDAARAIMTTDTFPKLATRTARIGGAPVTLNGFAKGAGMIAPDMATMLAFVFTDAAVAAPALQALLTRGADKSFNCVTVDGDTSTSDTLLLFATGAAARHGAPAIPAADDERLAPFRNALDDLLIDLAQQVARDGEGARKFVTVRVTGAADDCSARRIALSIANSPLVKTAVAGEDANWGRVVMAVGKAGEPADRDRLAIWFGDVRVAVEGRAGPGLRRGASLGGDEAAGDHDSRRHRPRGRRGAGLDLRPHQGLRRDQRGLPLVRNGLVLAFVCGLAVGGPAAAQTIEAGRLKFSAAPRSSAPRITPPSRSAF